MNKFKKASLVGLLTLVFGFAVGAVALYNVSKGLPVPNPQKIACPFFCVLGLILIRAAKQKSSTASGSA